MTDFEALKKIFRGDVATDNATLEAYSADTSIFKIRPAAVVFPKDAEDITQLVKWVIGRRKRGARVSLTARSAGTDMSGGPLNESVIVSFIPRPGSGQANYFNHIKEIGPDYAVVEPGVYFRDFEKELDKRGLLYPPYPASKDLCAIGGMIANNSGGERTLAYGKTEDYVESLQVVLADGEVHELEPLSAAQLKKKIKAKTFEGKLYAKLYALIEKNYGAIQKARPDVSKNSAGYNLWDVWDTKTFDILKLIVGSQGTLGLVTEAKLKLVKKRKYSRLIVVFTRALDPVPGFVNAILRFNPESIESYDDKTLEVALRFLPSLIKMTKGNIFTLIWDFMPEFWMILKGGIPKMALLIEITSDEEAGLEEKTELIREAAARFPLQLRVIKTPEEAEKYWTIRRQSFALLHDHAKKLSTAPFVDDIIVRPEYLPEVLPKVNAILAKYKKKLIYTIAGHPGNGNFHIIPLVNLKDPAIPGIMREIMDEIYKLVVSYGGSITAEHNDGLIRSPYLEMMYGKKMYGLFKEVKKIFDPQGIFNPGKKTGSSLDYSFAHLKK